MQDLKSTLKATGLHEYISSAAEIIDESRAGRMFILVDDEDRENEGDLLIAAQFATPDAINFMAKHGRGLICLAMTKNRCERLGLPLMSQANGTRHETAFTVSIEAKEGVTTGISAADRARTVAVAINPEHTEAAVDIARLAGLTPAGVICEIMNDDGTMARLPDLVSFAQRHNLKLGTIADLIAHRRRTEKLVKRAEQGMVPGPYGEVWRMIAYTSMVDNIEHLAMVMGDLQSSEPVLVRMHAIDTMSDLRENRPTAVSDRIRNIVRGTLPEPALRDYGIGAQILIDLGVRDMILLSNHRRTIVGLDGYGLNVVEQREIIQVPIVELPDPPPR
jgi:3,4-dihydroxy 2-butanone 4-phosphate synthase/GTP cyclohydrolase II